MTNESIDESARRVSIVIGVSAADAAQQIQMAIERLGSASIPPIPDLSKHFSRIEEQRRQERWATDPMELMRWFSLNQWRWWMVDRIGNVQDALGILSGWIEPE